MHRLTRYGLSPETFDQMLADQGYACGMCLVPFKDGQLICIDHDHRCCPQEKKSCGRCVRGLLCLGCNRALGVIESKYAQAHQYLKRCPREVIACRTNRDRHDWQYPVKTVIYHRLRAEAADRRWSRDRRP
jgi:hypothetical protein